MTLSCNTRVGACFPRGVGSERHPVIFFRTERRGPEQVQAKRLSLGLFPFFSLPGFSELNFFRNSHSGSQDAGGFPQFLGEG